MNNDANFASQHIWSDAMFIRHVQRLEELDGAQLLKLAVLALLYGSPDVAFLCLRRHDALHGGTLAQAMPGL